MSRTMVSSSMAAITAALGVCLVGCVKFPQGYLDAAVDAMDAATTDLPTVDARADTASADAGVDVGITDAGVDVGITDAPSDILTDSGGSDGPRCPSGQVACPDHCRDLQSDTAHCGRCDRVCTSPDGSVAVCTLGACSSAPLVRLISPLSTSVLTSQTPTLSWVAPAPGGPRISVQVCSDRACTMIETRLVPDASNASASFPTGPSAPVLPAGPHFWRLIARDSGSVVSPVWEFFVKNRAFAFSSVSQGPLDFDGDGYADIAVTGASSTRVSVYFGDASSSLSRFVVLPSASDHTTGQRFSAPAGDVNGDGYGDVLVGYLGSGLITVFFGGPVGPVGPVTPPSTATVATLPQFGSILGALGDVDGDGYGDIVVNAGGTSTVVFGRATGPSYSAGDPTGHQYINESNLTGVGDLNGDGLVDAVASNSSNINVYLGTGHGLVASTATAIAWPGADAGVGGEGAPIAAAGDFNGDGLSDVVFCDRAAQRAYVFSGDRTNLLSTLPALILTPGSTTVNESAFSWGSKVAGLGDVNGDGIDDIAVGYVTSTTEGDGGGTTTNARFSVYLGSADAPPLPINRVFTDMLGVSEDFMGATWDINRSGRSNVLVQQPNAVLIFAGNSTGVDSSYGMFSP